MPYFLTDEAFNRTNCHSKFERFPPIFIYFILLTFLSSYTLDRNFKNRSSKRTLKMHIIIPLLRLLQFQKQTMNVCWGSQHFLNNIHNSVPTSSQNCMYFFWVQTCWYELFVEIIRYFSNLWLIFNFCETLQIPHGSLESQS